MPELVWDGKYSNGTKVAPVRIALPFQTIETVNESAQRSLSTRMRQWVHEISVGAPPRSLGLWVG